MRGVGKMVTATLAMFLVALPGWAQESARVSLINGVPDTPIDVEVEGTLLFTGLGFGRSQDLSLLAGTTLTSLHVKESGSDTTLIDAGSLDIPDSGHHTIVAHLDQSGTPTLTVFPNDTSTIGAGVSRLVVRNTAAAPPIEVLIDDTSTFGNLSSGNEVSGDFPASTVMLSIVAADDTEQVLVVPTTVDLVDGESLIVYTVGSSEEGPLQLLTERVVGLGTAPSGVSTGNTPVGMPGTLWALFALLATLAAVALGRRASR